MTLRVLALVVVSASGRQLTVFLVFSTVADYFVFAVVIPIHVAAVDLCCVEDLLLDWWLQSDYVANLLIIFSIQSIG